MRTCDLQAIIVHWIVVLKMISVIMGAVWRLATILLPQNCSTVHNVTMPNDCCSCYLDFSSITSMYNCFNMNVHVWFSYKVTGWGLGMTG